MLVPLSEFLRKYALLTVSILSLILISVYINNQIAQVVSLALFILFLRRNVNAEGLLFFFAILICSDNYSLTFAQSIKPVMVIVLAAVMLLNKGKIQVNMKIVEPFIPFFILSIFVLALNPDGVTGFQKYFSYILMFLIIPTFFSHLYKKFDAEFIKDLCTFHVLVLLCSLVFYFVNIDLAISHGGRFRGIFGNPNGLAMYCLFTFLSYRIFSSKLQMKVSRSFVSFTMVVIVVTLVLSASRTSMMGVLIFFIFTWTERYSSYLTAFALISIFSANDLIYQTFIDLIVLLDLGEVLRIDTLTVDGGKLGSGRVVAWKFAWDIIQENFFLGKGWGFDERLFHSKAVFSMLSALNHQGGVHNIYLGLWLNEGLIGLVLFMYGLIHSFVKYIKVSNYVIPAFCSMLFLGGFEPWLLASLNPYTIQMLFILTFLYMATLELNKQIEEPEAAVLPSFS